MIALTIATSAPDHTQTLDPSPSGLAAASTIATEPGAVGLAMAGAAYTRRALGALCGGASRYGGDPRHDRQVQPISRRYSDLGVP